MGEFKGTKGQAKVIKHSWSDTSVMCNNEAIATLFICNEDEDEEVSEQRMFHDASLIADAFNVRQQINCDLPELLRQRNELHYALQAIVDNIETWLETGVPADSETSNWLYKIAKQAIVDSEGAKGQCPANFKGS